MLLLPWLHGCLVVAGLHLLQLVHGREATRAYIQPCRAPKSQGWISNGRYCYLISSSKSTFNDSKQKCSTNGGDLVSIHSKNETTFLVEAITSLGLIESSFMQTAYWTGLQKEDGGETHRWSDLSDLDYTSWADGEPNNDNKNEKCVECLVNGWWNDIPCDVTKGYICKKPDSAVREQSTGCKAKCKDGWISAGRSCYLVSYDKLLLDEARFFCKTHDADLLSVHDGKDSLLVTFAAADLGYGSSYWIGLRARGEGDYQWLDGSGTAVNYNNWFTGQPNQNPKKCVEMFPIGTYNLAHCEDMKSYICKKIRLASESVAWPDTWDRFTDEKSIYARPPPHTVDTYAGAINSCRLHGGHIVSIHSAEEAQSLRNVWRRGLHAEYYRVSYWIGLQLQTDGSFNWADGTSYDYRIWQVEPPKQTNKDCVEMLRIGSWNSASCDEQKPFICKASEVKEPGCDVGNSELCLNWFYRPTTVAAMYISSGLVIALLAISWIAYGLWRCRRKRGQPKLPSQEAEQHGYETTLMLSTPNQPARGNALNDDHAYACIKFE